MFDVVEDLLAVVPEPPLIKETFERFLLDFNGIDIPGFVERIRNDRFIPAPHSGA